MKKASSVIGIDIGGTTTAVALYEKSSGKMIVGRKLPTDAPRGFPAIVEEVFELVEELRTPQTVSVGIGIAGLTRLDGVIHTCPNIPGADGFALRERAEKRLRLKVAVENDSSCFALAEALHGAGKGHGVVVGVTMGTGVGGGIVIDGTLLRGAHGFAGEIGHMLLRPGEPPYPTEDRRGEIEQFLSGTAMGRRCAAAKRPEEYLEGEVCAFMQPEVFRETAWMITSLTHLLDPSIIVLGGSAGRALKPHLKEVKAELDAWLLPKMPVPLIAIAERQDAGTLGAAMLTA